MPGRFSPREQQLVITVTVLIGVWFTFSGIVEPLWERSQRLAQQVEAETSKLEKLSGLLAKRDTVERSYAEIAAFLTQVSDGDASILFLGELEVLARHANVQIDLKPKPIKYNDELRRVGVELNLEASQERVFAFLDALFSMPTLLDIQRLHISSAPGKQNVLRAHLIIQKVALANSPPR